LWNDWAADYPGAPEIEPRNATMKRTTQTLPAETGNTDITRFNALRHGVLSRYTVLPWESADEPLRGVGRSLNSTPLSGNLISSAGEFAFGSEAEMSRTNLPRRTSDDRSAC